MKRLSFSLSLPFLVALACAGDDSNTNATGASSTGGATSGGGSTDGNDSAVTLSGGQTSSGGDTEATVTAGDTEVTTGDTGGVDAREYYDGELSAALGAAENEARCSTCHSDDGTRYGFSGATFENIAYKTNYKGGQADLLGAVNACVTGWMGGAALTEDSEAFVALVSFMQGISDESETTPNPLAPEVLANRDAYEAAYADGDAVAGEAKFEAVCGKCHGANLVLNNSTTPAIALLSAASIGQIAQQVRTSGPPPSGTEDAEDLTPGPMPFFEISDLSEADLADIIAFIQAG